MSEDKINPALLQNIYGTPEYHELMARLYRPVEVRVQAKSSTHASVSGLPPAVPPVSAHITLGGMPPIWPPPRQ